MRLCGYTSLTSRRRRFPLDRVIRGEGGGDFLSIALWGAACFNGWITEPEAITEKMLRYSLLLVEHELCFNREPFDIFQLISGKHEISTKSSSTCENIYVLSKTDKKYINHISSCCQHRHNHTSYSIDVLSWSWSWKVESAWITLFGFHALTLYLVCFVFLFLERLLH